MLLYDPFDYWGRVRPEGIFARDEQRELTNGEAVNLARRIAARLIDEGIVPGDRVAVLSGNYVELLVLYYGISYTGAVFVPINARFASDERKHVLADSGSRVLFVTADLFDATNLPDDAPKVVVCRGDAPAGCTGFDAWVGQVEPLTDLPAVSRDDDAFQVYTSGTTGKPKAAVLTHGAAFEIIHRWQMAGVYLEPGSTLFLALPANLGAGLYVCLNGVYNGATVQLASSFNPAEVVRVLDEADGSIGTAMVPTMIQACLAVDGAHDRHFANLKWILYGAAPIAVDVLRDALDTFGCGFVQGFGQTEVSCITFLLPADHEDALRDNPERLKSVGRVTAGVKIRFVDAMDLDVPHGQPGEIAVRADFAMRCYWNAEELTAETMRGGWLHTGDVGYMDDDGFLFVVDRIKDMIISGGLNVYPREVELVLESFPEIAQVAVIGLPSEKWGEEVMAVVRLNPDASITAGEIIDRCRERLADYKTPKSVEFVDAFELNANGKLLKHRLRDRYATAAAST